MTQTWLEGLVLYTIATSIMASALQDAPSNALSNRDDNAQALVLHLVAILK